MLGIKRASRNFLFRKVKNFLRHFGIVPASAPGTVWPRYGSGTIQPVVRDVLLKLQNFEQAKKHTGPFINDITQLGGRGLTIL